MRHSLRTPAFAVLLLTLALAACTSEQTDPVNDEPDLAAMILDVNSGVQYTATASGFGAQTLTISNAGFTINGVEFQRPGGDPETIVNDEDFRLSVAGDADGGPLPAGVSFTRTGSFSGNVAGIQESQTIAVYFSLYHIEPDHIDFGPFALSVTRPELPGGGGEE
jgi:hypothetical protein